MRRKTNVFDMKPVFYWRVNRILLSNRTFDEEIERKWKQKDSELLNWILPTINLSKEIRSRRYLLAHSLSLLNGKSTCVWMWQLATPRTRLVGSVQTTCVIKFDGTNILTLNHNLWSPHIKAYVYVHFEEVVSKLKTESNRVFFHIAMVKGVSCVRKMANISISNAVLHGIQTMYEQ